MTDIGVDDKWYRQNILFWSEIEISVEFQINLLYFVISHIEISGYTVYQNIKTFEFHLLCCFKAKRVTYVLHPINDIKTSYNYCIYQNYSNKHVHEYFIRIPKINGAYTHFVYLRNVRSGQRLCIPTFQIHVTVTMRGYFTYSYESFVSHLSP